MPGKAGVGRGIADGRVAALIDCDAWHKPPYSVVAIAESLLLRSGRGKGATCNIKLIPTNLHSALPGNSPLWSDPPNDSMPATIVINNGSHDFITKSLDEECSLLGRET